MGARIGRVLGDVPRRRGLGDVRVLLRQLLGRYDTRRCLPELVFQAHGGDAGCVPSTPSATIAIAALRNPGKASFRSSGKAHSRRARRPPRRRYERRNLPFRRGRRRSAATTAPGFVSRAVAVRCDRARGVAETEDEHGREKPHDSTGSADRHQVGRVDQQRAGGAAERADTNIAANQSRPASRSRATPASHSATLFSRTWIRLACSSGAGRRRYHCP